MLSQEIVAQLKTIVPKYTNAFTNNIGITSLTRSGNTVTATTAAEHKLSVGNVALINGAKTPIQIESLTSFSGYAVAITTQQHNLTKFNVSTEISGANEIGYNGTKKIVWKAPLVDVESIAIAGDIATVITKTLHGLNDNSKLRFNIFGAQQSPYNQNNISVLSIISPTSFTYQVYGANENAFPNMRTGKMQMQIELNANTFMYEVASDLSSPATGDIFQLSTYLFGYNGHKVIASTPSTTSFTYQIEEEPLSPAQGSIILQTLPCVESFITLEECTKHFLSKDGDNSQNWIYVVLDDENASKNNKTKGDSLTYGNSGTDIREESYQNVNVYIYLKNGVSSGRNQLSSANLRDLGYSFKPFIYKALLGYRPTNNLTDDLYSQLMPVNNGVQDFNGAIMIYRYTFQATSWVNESDSADKVDIFAFRAFDFDVLDNLGYNESVMKIKGRLDDAN